MLNVIMLYKTNLNKYKISIFYMFYKRKCKKLCLSFSIPAPGFPLFYYMLGANLGLLLYRDVSVITDLVSLYLCYLKTPSENNMLGQEC